MKNQNYNFKINKIIKKKYIQNIFQFNYFKTITEIKEEKVIKIINKNKNGKEKLFN